ncbi:MULTISPECIES: bifunctional hydroxymethylpyrimidine kinase/phosphomethylpyrimidine kinase [Rhodomicrobium]|uniref:bifunctional hydroxymethylpyrimidine kinase/phosphomethylpyrimidine kinase n=1 Tax=Rhodomicrobium TaxID=1068 RepID=UPI000B4A9AF0|nr:MULTISPECIES: bifunctional hydroxymethylpyrimidine kinase/phosphomethylpyrimidine kinase [Rhodomicrobium]
MISPIALTIAGSDSSGGAGIQADLKTFSALGVYGASVIAALTAQNTKGVSAIHMVPPDFIRAQMDAVFSDLDVRAVKIGMLGTEAAIISVAEKLTAWAGPQIVLDPVMVAGSGDPLLDGGAEFALRAHLLPLADIVTPNIPEAARLLGAAEAVDEKMMVSQGELLLSLGAKAVLMKGGHGSGPEAVDIFLDGSNIVRLAADRIRTKHTHGTGCTLASAITASLAKGMTMLDAVREAKVYLTNALIKADDLAIGHGSGPVHHFYALWPKIA